MRQGLALFCLVVVIEKGQGQGQGKGQRHGQGQGQGRIIGGEEAGAKEVPWQVKKYLYLHGHSIQCLTDPV